MHAASALDTTARYRRATATLTHGRTNQPYDAQVPSTRAGIMRDCALWVGKWWFNPFGFSSFRPGKLPHVTGYTCVILLLHFFCCFGQNIVSKSWEKLPSNTFPIFRAWRKSPKTKRRKSALKRRKIAQKRYTIIGRNQETTETSFCFLQNDIFSSNRQKLLRLWETAIFLRT